MFLRQTLLFCQGCLLYRARCISRGPLRRRRTLTPRLLFLFHTRHVAIRTVAFDPAPGDPAGGEGARQQIHIVRQVFEMIGLKHFPEARGMAQKIDDPSIGSQVRTLIDFGETTAAIDRTDSQ